MKIVKNTKSNKNSKNPIINDRFKKSSLPLAIQICVLRWSNTIIWITMFLMKFLFLLITFSVIIYLYIFLFLVGLGLEPVHRLLLGSCWCLFKIIRKMKRICFSLRMMSPIHIFSTSMVWMEIKIVMDNVIEQNQEMNPNESQQSDSNSFDYQGIFYLDWPLSRFSVSVSTKKSICIFSGAWKQLLQSLLFHSQSFVYDCFLVI